MTTTTVPNQQQGASKNPSPTQEQQAKQQEGSQPQQQKPQQQQPQPPQQQQAAMFDANVIKGKWKQLTSSAKSQWKKLTEEELTKSGGDEQKLTGLVKDRYVIPHDEANKQVKSFFAKNTN